MLTGIQKRRSFIDRRCGYQRRRLDISVIHEQKGASVYVTGVKVFSATKAKEREILGDNVTRWLAANKDIEIVDKIVTQSSDSEFHCLTITLFYRAKSQAA